MSRSADVAAKAVFARGIDLASAGRWVTPDLGKRSSESDFDSGGPSVLASSQRTRGRGEDQTRP